MTKARAWLIVAALLIAAGAFEPFYFRVFFQDRARFGAMLAELPYRKTPGLRRFYADVRARTPKGSSIVIAAPYREWDGGYEYVYARSMYALAGRNVLTLLDPQNRPHPENFAKGDFIAAYRSEPRVPGFETIWRGPDGALLRRTSR